MPTLPPEFADIEPFADWCLRTEAERYAKRLSSSIDEMQAFWSDQLGAFKAHAERKQKRAVGDRPEAKRR